MLISIALLNRARRTKRSSPHIKFSTMATNRKRLAIARYRIKSSFWAESFAILSKTRTCCFLSAKSRLLIRNRLDLYPKISPLVLPLLFGSNSSIKSLHTLPGVWEKSTKINRHRFRVVSAMYLIRLVRPIPYFPVRITLFPRFNAFIISLISFSRPTKNIPFAISVESGRSFELIQEHPQKAGSRPLLQFIRPVFFEPRPGVPLAQTFFDVGF